MSLLEATRISMRFGGVVALRDVDVRQTEVSWVPHYWPTLPEVGIFDRPKSTSVGA